MTNETPTPDSLTAKADAAPASTTVFSDGSTFDYENGYQNNGAPVATRDRTEKPTIVKSHKIVTADRVLGVLGSALVLAVLAFVVFAFVSVYQSYQNIDAVKSNINESGQVEVMQRVEGGLILKDLKADVLLKCDLSMISNNGNPLGLVFCVDAKPATLSIPLPHDPSNIFYSAPEKDSEDK